MWANTLNYAKVCLSSAAYAFYRLFVPVELTSAHEGRRRSPCIRCPLSEQRALQRSESMGRANAWLRSVAC